MATHPMKHFYLHFIFDCLGVLPPDCESDTIAKYSRGKVPGYMKDDGKWVGATGKLEDRKFSLEQAKAAARTGAVTGLQARNFSALDCDSESRVIVDAVKALATKMLGKAPWRDREGSPRCLGMYYGPGHRKRRLVFFPPGQTTPEAIEWLGAGQYYNVAGMHKSGHPYRWDTLPYEIAHKDFAYVDEETLELFWDALRKLLARLGCLFVSSAIAGTPGSRKRIGDPSMMAPNAELVLKALAAYPCNAEHFKDRLDIVPFLCAVKASLGKDCEHYQPDVLEWFFGHPDAADEDYFDKIWDSIEDSSLDWAWLDGVCGTGFTADEDFTDHPEAVGDKSADPEIYPPDPRTVAMQAMLTRYAYVKKQERFYDLEANEELTPTNFDVVNNFLAPWGTPGKKSAHGQYLNHPDRRVYSSLDYAAGKPPIYNDKVNIWRPGPLVPIYGENAQIWLDHVEEMFPAATDRDHVLDFMAHTLQHRGVKINHGLVLVTLDHGPGKDTVFDPLVHALGVDNYKVTTPEELCSERTRYLQAELIIVAEMKNFHKGEVYNRLKQFLARPPDRVPLRLMYKDVIEIENNQNWAFFSNAADAISVERGDRRLLVPKCKGHPKDDLPYWARLWGFLKEQNGREIVAGHLLKRDISKFDRFNAPMTEMKQEMIELATPPGVIFLNDQFSEGRPLFGRRVVTTFELRELLNEDFTMAGIRDVQIVNVLRQHGFEKIPGRHRIMGDPRNVWTTLSNPETLAKGDISLEARWKADKK